MFISVYFRVAAYSFLGTSFLSLFWALVRQGMGNLSLIGSVKFNENNIFGTKSYFTIGKPISAENEFTTTQSSAFFHQNIITTLLKAKLQHC